MVFQVVGFHPLLPSLFTPYFLAQIPGSTSDLPPGSPLAEIFYSDIDGKMTFTAFTKESIPLPIIHRFIESAEKDLRLS